MDSPSANAKEDRQSPLKPSATPYSVGRTAHQRHEAIATSSNAVNDAFVAFHNAQMANAASNRDLNSSISVNGSITDDKKQNMLKNSTASSDDRRGGRGGIVNLPRDRASGQAGFFAGHEASQDDPGEGSPSNSRGRGRGDWARGGGGGGGGRGASGGGGRGRMFDLSHVRGGRGRGGLAPERSRAPDEGSAERIDTRSHERGGRHTRGGGREGHGGRQAHGRGRGTGYDADFDRGKSAQERRAEAHKQLYQAPMGYRSESRPGQSEKPTDLHRRADSEVGQGRNDSRGVHDDERNSSDDDEDLNDKAADSPEPAARPGIINTGIDVTAVQQSSRRTKGERRDKGRRRDAKERSEGRDRPQDVDTRHGQSTQSRLEHEPWPHHMHLPPPFHGPPPPHLFGGPPPFPFHHHPPPLPPHSSLYDPHLNSRGPPPPPPGHWPPPHPFDSPPHPHRDHHGARGRGTSPHTSQRGETRRSRQDRVTGSTKKIDTASLRDNASRDERDRSSTGYGSPVPGPRQLFNPSKDDPVRFSAQKAPSSTAPESAYDTRSVASSATRTSASSLSVASSSYRSRYSGRSDALLDEVESTASGAGSNALLRELKASYKEIMNVEAKLQDEDSYAKAVLEEQSKVTDREPQARALIEHRPDEYWANLVRLHREAAEAFHSFMERCMDPMIPASIHSISQKYNLPARMWKSAFLLLFERLRQALPLSNADTAKSEVHGTSTEPSSISVLEHLHDFIYYAYTFYTQLLEQQSLSAFRATWIEQLGDIARFRMAVAELSMFTPANAHPLNQPVPSSSKSLRAFLEDLDHIEVPLPQPVNDDDHRENDRTPRKQLISRKDRKKGFPGIPAKLAEDMEVADAPGNSIGAAALDDWEVVENETWRLVAQEWYFIGLGETPGTGRLHHHLASMAGNDELRALYHYLKSLAASHPYSSGSDSILEFFSLEKQALRLQPDAPALSLFVHLNGLLYSRVGLDTFNSVLARFEEKLEETFAYIKAQAQRASRRASRGRAHEDPAQRLSRDSTWIMMAVTSIAAMMEFGREDGVFKSALGQAQDQKRSGKHSSKAERKTNSRSDPTPSEASLNELARQVEQLGLEISKNRATGRVKESSYVPIVPLHLRLAMRLAFSILNNTLRHPMKPGEADPAICPYITIMLTFLSTLAHNPTVLAVLRSEVPWEKIVSFVNTLPKYAVTAHLRQDSSIPNRLLGVTLPEDWCIRGLDWTGKQLFGRGYWKGKMGTAYVNAAQNESAAANGREEASGYCMPESEKDVLAERYEGPSMPPHAGGPQSAFAQISGATMNEDNQVDEDGDLPTDRETVARLRWKRVALSAAWLARAVPFLAVEDETLVCDQVMFDAITEEDKNHEASASDAVVANGNAKEEGNGAAEDMAEQDEDDSFLGSADESEIVKELKARRRELKALLQESRASSNNKTQQALSSFNNSSGSQAQRRATRPNINALAGYTTLVFDTNVLLEAMDTFMALLTSKRWSLIVPLAVVTELDGLRTKEDNLGASATQAIKFLEDAIKTYSTNLKVQTSRGNYLRDLNIRREDIDFGHSPSYAGGRKSAATDGSVKSMDDVILNVAIWQKTNWLDRRALLGLKLASSSSSSANPAKTVLVSSDRTLRLKGKARGLEVCDASALEQLLEQPPNG